MAKRDYDYMFKLFLIGDSAVGKTSIIRKFANTDEIIDQNHIATVGIDFKIKTIELCGKKVKLQIWDTAGQERFHTITRSFYRDANGILFVYDLTNASSFDNIAKWLRNVKEHADEDVVKMLVGNKCDLDHIRVVSSDHGIQAAESFDMPFTETSALNDINIKKVFFDITRQLIEREEKDKRVEVPIIPHINLKDNKTSQDQYACCSYSYKKWYK